MDIKVIALSLLLLRLVATGYILLVLKKQVALIRSSRQSGDDLGNTRKALFALALVILLGQFIPILIDTATLLADIKRSNPNPLGVAYAYSNAFTAVLSSLLLWILYRIAGSDKRDRRKGDKKGRSK